MRPEWSPGKPVRAGQRCTVRIDDLGHAGEGVGRVGGLAVFVPGLIPCDEALVEIEEVKPRHGRGRAVELLCPSPDRIAPPCPVADRCGGCQLQPMAYPAQLRWKERRVREDLLRIGGLSPPVHPIVGMDRPWEYRNKAQYPVGLEQGRIVMGFYERGSHRIVDAEACMIQDPANVRAARAARALLAEYRIPPYDEVTGKGVLRHVIVRSSGATGEVMVVLVTSVEAMPHAGEIVSRLVEEVPEVSCIAQNVNPLRTNVIFGDVTRLLWGKPHIEDTLCGLRFLVSPRSFFQINPVQAEVLYATVASYARLTGRETLLDVYCGTGTITLCLARQAARAVGVEATPEAVADARQNARRNGIDNVSFVAGRAGEILPRLVRQGLRPDVVVVDPPRRGCEEEALAAIAAVEPPRIVYVSCNPATLARDLKWLAGRGYRTLEVQPVDMFPMTAHVESVARVARDDGIMKR